MWTWVFWRDTGERVISTAAASLLAFFGVQELDLFNVNWSGALSVAGATALVTLLKSLVAANVGERGTAALLPSSGGRHEKPYFSGEVIR